MSRTAAPTTLNPTTFGTGNGIYFEDAVQVVEQINYTASRTPQVLAQWIAAPSGWGASGNEPHAHSVTFSGSLETFYQTDVWIDPDAQEIRIEVDAAMAAGNEGEVVVDLGGAQVVLAFDDSTPTVTDQVSSGDTGTGWQSLTVRIQRTSGASSANALRRVQVSTEPWASLPVPLDE